MAKQVPLVEYLKLGKQPHLVAQECASCGARYFDRRNACASCFGTEFKPVPVATSGEVRAFTIVSLAAPGIPVPFVAAVVGGFFSLPGAIAGGVLVGVVETFSGAYVGSSFKEFVAFILLIGVLLVRPHGLFGVPEARRV